MDSAGPPGREARRVEAPAARGAIPHRAADGRGQLLRLNITRRGAVPVRSCGGKTRTEPGSLWNDSSVPTKGLRDTTKNKHMRLPNDRPSEIRQVSTPVHKSTTLGSTPTRAESSLMKSLCAHQRANAALRQSVVSRRGVP